MNTCDVEAARSDGLPSSQGHNSPVNPISSERLIIERRKIRVSAPAGSVYQSFVRLGGARGWLYLDWAWELRRIVGRLSGGVGMRWGRRELEDLRVGDTLDLWRVDKVKPGRLIRLWGEMRIPGRAWLEFEACSLPYGQTLLLLTAFFEPKGVTGLLYWYALYPVHSLIFSGLIQKIAVESVN